MELCGFGVWWVWPFWAADLGLGAGLKWKTRKRRGGDAGEWGDGEWGVGGGVLGAED